MQAIDLSKPGEKKKLIWAGALGLAAILVLWWVFFGFGGSSNPKTTARTATAPSPTPAPGRTQPGIASPNNLPPEVASVADYRPVEFVATSYNAPEATRNIFAYYVAPPTPSPVVVVSPTPPPPPPPLLLASVSPSNVYARSGDFKLEVAGDKFIPAAHVYMDGRELPTTYTSPQQLSATVSASLIAAPGVRQIQVRTADNQLYSNAAPLNVAQAPTPNFTYVGIISPHTRVDDTALVQDKSNRNILNVHRGDVIGGRFRVTSISDKELVLMDTNLKIKHTLAMTEGDRNPSSPLTRPTPRVEAEDDEP